MTFSTQRVSLLAGVSTPVKPPISARAVEIGNASGDDLKVYSALGDESSFFVVSAGYAKHVDLFQHRFDSYQVAFYLKGAVDGTAVLVWA